MPKQKVTDEQIREAAYHMWRKEGEPHGNDQEYWYRAEEALTVPKPKRAPAKKTAAKKAPAKKPAAKTAAKKAPAKTASKAKS